MQRKKIAKIIGIAGLTFILANVAGCVSFSATPKAKIQAQPNNFLVPARFNEEKRQIIGLALGGGGMRGYAHIGALQALEESGIRPDVISGTSVGSVIGALYAAGKSPDELWSIAQDIKIWSMVDFTISTESLMKGDKITDWMNSLVNDKSIEQFEIPYAAIATDMQAETPVMITSGNTGFAIRASAAIPGIMAAVPYGTSELVDGGMTSMVPVRAAKKLGADVVIGIDIYCNGERYEGSDIPTVVLRVSQMQSCLISQQESQEADVLIAPYMPLPIEEEEDQSKEIARKIGYEATMAQIDKIRALIQQSTNGELDHPIVTASILQKDK